MPTHTTISEAARAMGRLGGAAGTAAQNAARRQNGRQPCRPGRHRGRPRKTYARPVCAPPKARAAKREAAT